VELGLTSSDVGEGTVSSATLTYSTSNWNAAQTVTVTGLADGLVDGNVAFSVITDILSSSDLDYNGVAVADVGATNNGMCTYTHIRFLVFRAGFHPSPLVQY
jgi:hypothetical protein